MHPRYNNQTKFTKFIYIDVDMDMDMDIDMEMEMDMDITFIYNDNQTLLFFSNFWIYLYTSDWYLRLW